MQPKTPIVVLSELPPAERDRFLDFLAVHRVEFTAEKGGTKYTAKVRVVRPRGGGDRGGHRTDPSAGPRGAVAAGVAAAAAATAFAATGGSTPGSPPNSARGRHPTPGRGQTQLAPSADERLSPAKAAEARAMQAELRRKYQRFCGAIPPSALMPREMISWTELRRFIEDVYAFRFAQDAEKLKAEAAAAAAVSRGEAAPTIRPGRNPPPNFPKTVLAYAGKKWGVPVMVEQACWNVVYSVDHLREKHEAAELFGRFLEESYDLMDLLFYLNARDSSVRALQQVRSGQWVPVGHGLPNKLLQQTPRPAPPPPPPKTPVLQTVDAKLAIRIVRDCVQQQQLQDRILRERLNTAMVESGGDSLEVDSFLKVLTEEYHAARGSTVGLPGEVTDAVLESKVLDFLAFVRYTCGSSLGALFDEMDSSGSGIVQRADFVRVLGQRGYKGDASDIWRLLDRDGAGVAGRKEFAHLGGSSREAEAPGELEEKAVARAAVTISFSIRGLDHAKLTASEEAIFAMTEALQKAVALEAAAEDVTVKFLPAKDAVKVQCAVTCPAGGPEDASVLLKRLQGISIDQAVMRSLSTDEALKAIAGDIRISDISKPVVRSPDPEGQLQREQQQQQLQQQQALVEAMAFSSLDPEVQREAEDTAERLRAALEARGMAGVRLQDVRGWAIQVALKRHERRRSPMRSRGSMIGDAVWEGGASGRSGHPSTYSVSLEEVQSAWQSLYCSGAASQVGSSRRPPVAPDDLEGAVRRALEVATEELASKTCREVCNSIATSGGGMVPVQALARAGHTLGKELTPVADALLEALVNNDLGAWLKALRFPASEFGNAAESKGPAFTALRADLQKALSTDLERATLERLCRGVVSTPELRSMAKESATRLLSDLGRLPGSGPSREGPRATTTFGGHSSSRGQGASQSAAGEGGGGGGGGNSVGTYSAPLGRLVRPSRYAAAAAEAQPSAATTPPSVPSPRSSRPSHSNAGGVPASLAEVAALGPDLGADLEEELVGQATLLLSPGRGGDEEGGGDIDWTQGDVQEVQMGEGEEELLEDADADAVPPEEDEELHGF